jgi:hypothetical protein
MIPEELTRKWNFSVGHIEIASHTIAKLNLVKGGIQLSNMQRRPKPWRSEPPGLFEINYARSSVNFVTVCLGISTL